MKKNIPKQSKSDLSESKTEFIRKNYNQSAKFYDNRYESIQFVKYSLLLPTIIQRSKCKTQQIGQFGNILTLESPMLDVGGGGGLLIRFLNLFQMYLDDVRDGSEIEIEEFCNDLIQKYDEFNLFLFEYVKTQINNSHNITPPIRFKLPEIIVCDISFEMLQQIGESDSQVNNLYPFLCGKVECDVSFLPFRNGLFSTITSFTVIQNLEAPQTAVRELSRISNDKAHFLISILQKMGPKTRTIDAIANINRGLHEITLGENQIDEIKTLIKSLESKFQLYFEKDIVYELQNSEDYLFWI